MKCRSAQTNAGSFAANAGLRELSVAVIPGRDTAGMLVGLVLNAGYYTYVVSLLDILAVARGYLRELFYLAARQPAFGKPMLK